MVNRDCQCRDTTVFVNDNIINRDGCLIVIRNGHLAFIFTEDDIETAGLEIGELDQEFLIGLHLRRIHDGNGDGFDEIAGTERQ